MDEVTKIIIKNFEAGMIKDELLKNLAEEIGIENFCKVLEHIGGMQLYIPRLDRVLIPARDKSIKNEFDGSNFAFLAKKYELTERTIRDIIAGGQIIGQISIEDMLEKK